MPLKSYKNTNTRLAAKVSIGLECNKEIPKDCWRLRDSCFLPLRPFQAIYGDTCPEMLSDCNPSSQLHIEHPLAPSSLMGPGGSPRGVTPMTSWYIPLGERPSGFRTVGGCSVAQTLLSGGGRTCCHRRGSLGREGSLSLGPSHEPGTELVACYPCSPTSLWRKVRLKGVKMQTGYV